MAEMRLALVIVGMLAISGCSAIRQFAEAIDDTCVVGKLSMADGTYLNSQHDKWTALKAKAGDRVVNAECSDALRGVEERG